jgi:Cu2+-exporting ATPase
MTACCPDPLIVPPDQGLADRGGLERWVREVGPGRLRLEALVPGVHCAACITRIEVALRAIPAVISARVNLSTRRVVVEWLAGKARPEDLVAAIAGCGYEVRPWLPSAEADDHKAEGRALLTALAIAGFAAANIMLLSVSVWSGADAATRDLFHWISALIAVPAVAFAGRPFFASAAKVLSRGRLNMDVPISLAVILAAAMSLYETMQSGADAYFDAAVTLLFFLLVGRYLDHMMRARARSAVTGLLALNSTGATVIDALGARSFVPAGELRPGMDILIAAGERIAADGEVVHGQSDLDRAALTGEPLPETVRPGSAVHAGTLNLTGPLRVRVGAAGDDTLMADIVRMMEAAEAGRGRYVSLAERMARAYAPAVHILAGATFLGWLVATGDGHAALLAAIAVLIITCPCALGLAVPAVQVVASGILFRRGILVKDATALERLAGIDRVVFDKTGTLTRGTPSLIPPIAAATGDLELALGLAQRSRHVLAQTIAGWTARRGIAPADFDSVTERPGEGLEGRIHAAVVRLGSRPFCAAGDKAAGAPDSELLEVWLARDGKPATRFSFEDAARADAGEVVAAFAAAGISAEIISGDREAPVAALARRLGIEVFRSGWLPGAKATYVEALEKGGHRVLMVGDGINDAPALAAAHVSMAPASGADIGLAAADFVFTGDRLFPVVFAWRLARAAERAIRQNFGLAIAYNLVAVPVAMAGHASPLIAAIAMSSSSLVVTANALRLRLMAGREPAP